MGRKADHIKVAGRLSFVRAHQFGTGHGLCEKMSGLPRPHALGDTDNLSARVQNQYCGQDLYAKFPGIGFSRRRINIFTNRDKMIVDYLRHVLIRPNGAIHQSAGRAPGCLEVYQEQTSRGFALPLAAGKPVMPGDMPRRCGDAQLGRHVG